MRCWVSSIIRGVAGYLYLSGRLAVCGAHTSHQQTNTQHLVTCLPAPPGPWEPGAIKAYYEAGLSVATTVSAPFPALWCPTPPP